MKTGLGWGECVICAFLALALTAIASEGIGPYAVAFAAEVRHGVAFDVFGYDIFIQEDAFLLQAAMYYGFYTIFFAGVLSVCFWHLRWWTVAITIGLGIIVVSAGVFNNELTYAVTQGQAPRYPDSLYWALALYYIVPIATCITVWAEIGSHEQRMQSVSPPAA